MATKYAFENLLRTPFELLVALVAFGFGFLCIYQHRFMAMDLRMGIIVSLPFFALAILRTIQGIKVVLYQKHLLKGKYYALSTEEVPVKRTELFFGKGFLWQGRHTQRKCLMNEVDNDRFKQKGKLYKWARKYETNHKNYLAHLLASNSFINPLKPLPPIGGQPWMHGLEAKEMAIEIKEAQRSGHTLILGTTRVGKTRLLSILVNQDIRNGKAVIILDPKGDLEILRDMYSACKISNRLADFKIVHVGFPSISARLNTLKSFMDISDVATRVTSAIGEGGEGAQFKAFAWRYVNIIAKCLHELKEPINYHTIGFYITRPAVLLLKYADAVLPAKDSNYEVGVNDILEELRLAKEERKNAKIPEAKRSEAIKRYLQKYIETSISNNESNDLINNVIVPLYDAAALDATYYQKITASVGPVLDMINQSNASSIFSFEENPLIPEVKLIEAIKRKQIVYIGLNSLVNRQVSEALGKAIISDLVSCAGQIYNSAEKHTVSVYCDEFSEIVQEEFVTLLNKSGGAGFQITAAAQTFHDIGAAFSGNHDKAKMLEGNFSTQLFMRVRNEETANLLVKQLPEVEVVSRTEGSSTNDTPHGEEGVYFNTSNDLRISRRPISLLHVSDITGLPIGHAFLLTNGGELYKLRIPLAKNDGIAPEDFVELIEEVNSFEHKDN